jgi:spore germination protein GerM
MRRLGPLVVVVVTVLAACGVPEDDGPQELSADEVPFGLLTTAPTTTSTPENLPSSRQAELFFINADDLVEAVERPVEDRAVQTVIETLLTTETSGLPPTFSSAIPPDTTLLDIRTEDGVLTVDLSEQFSSVEGTRFIAAVAQIVFTADRIAGIDAVEFRVEGERLEVGDETGATQDDPVTPLDYQGLLAPS